MEAVSYTHLDVYKRQVWMGALSPCRNQSYHKAFLSHTFTQSLLYLFWSQLFPLFCFWDITITLISCHNIRKKNMEHFEVGPSNNGTH